MGDEQQATLDRRWAHRVVSCRVMRGVHRRATLAEAPCAGRSAVMTPNHRCQVRDPMRNSPHCRHLKAHEHVDVPPETQHSAADPGSAATCCTKEVSLTEPFLGERVRSKSSNTASCMSFANLLAVMPSIPLMGYLALTHRFPLRKPIQNTQIAHTNWER